MEFFVDAADALEEIKAKKDLFYIEGEFFIVDVEKMHYEIPLNSIKTAQGVLHWAHHLCDKTWMDRDLIGYFIEGACEATGLDPHANT